jgi:hypothetical protein
MDDQDFCADQVDDDFYVFADQIDSIVDFWLYMKKDNKDKQPSSNKMGSSAVAPASSKDGLHLPQQQQQATEGAGHSGGSSTEDSSELPTLHSLLGRSELPTHTSKAAREALNQLQA